MRAVRPLERRACVPVRERPDDVLGAAEAPATRTKCEGLQAVPRAPGWLLDVSGSKARGRTGSQSQRRRVVGAAASGSRSRAGQSASFMRAVRPPNGRAFALVQIRRRAPSCLLDVSGKEVGGRPAQTAPSSGQRSRAGRGARLVRAVRPPNGGAPAPVRERPHAAVGDTEAPEPNSKGQAIRAVLPAARWLLDVSGSTAGRGPGSESEDC
jgi:hypothetical protein